MDTHRGRSSTTPDHLGTPTADRGPTAPAGVARARPGPADRRDHEARRSGPEGRGLAVALDALESDAVRWADAAARLRSTATTAEGQVLEPAAFSFAGGEVAAVYDGLRRRTATLLREGADNLDAVAAALRAGAASYVATEAAAARRLATAGGGPR